MEVKVDKKKRVLVSIRSRISFPILSIQPYSPRQLEHRPWAPREQERQIREQAPLPMTSRESMGNDVRWCEVRTGAGEDKANLPGCLSIAA
jgi:hypothetical protein